MVICHHFDLLDWKYDVLEAKFKNLKKKQKKNKPYNNFDFCPKSKQQAVAATSMFFPSVL